jgi:CubicO group peptidase (beta-lactamase class C family)
MKLRLFIHYLLLGTLSLACSTNDKVSDSIPDDAVLEMYFPPKGSNSWETLSLTRLEWNEPALDPLLEFLENSNTSTFIILYKGRIVVEQYFNGATSSSNLPWFSAGKTLTAFMVGIARKDGFLNLSDPSSEFLGSGWSSLTPQQEEAISIVHHLNMTTGLDYSGNGFCTDPECLQYLHPPGDFWYYHNAPYTLLQDIVSAASGESFNSYFDETLSSPIGMQGQWIPSGYNKFYFSNARSMARFGLLCLNIGVWDGTVILNDQQYFTEMTTPSQQLNRAYGYLWWLNGMSNFRVPGSVEQFSGALIPNAPDDLIAGLGANDQKLYIVPSRELVIVRQGGDGGEVLLGPSSYDNQLWSYLSDLIN